MTVMVHVLVFLFGAAVGSFLNVCIYRMEEGASIVWPHSFCPACKTPIKGYDNIPLLSYLLLRGRCRACGSPISIRYPVVEGLTALVFLLLFMFHGPSLDFLSLLIFASLLIVISFIDLDTQIIPDVLSLGGLALGFLLSFVRPGFRVLDSLYGILVGGGILFAVAYGYQRIARREGMGGGDIKLIAMIGAFCGLKGVVFSIMAGSCLGTLVGIPLMIVKGRDTKYAIPFGPFLSLGALLYVFAGARLTAGFLKVFSWG